MQGHGHGHGGGHDPGHGGGDGHGHGGDPARDRHGNPEDHAAYLARLLDPARDEWQKPDEVVAALGLRPGGVACEIGPGPGVFTLRLARAVGAEGRVHAVDVDPRTLSVLEAGAKAAGLANVRPLLAEDGRGLPPEQVDLVLIVNTFHHFPDPVAYLRELRARLRPDGRIVNVDFHGGELPVGPPPGHRVPREVFLDLAGQAGLVVQEERDFLPYQYFVALRAG